MAYFTDDILDSRDIIDRLDELQDEIEALEENIEEGDYQYESDEIEDQEELADLEDERKILQDFADECKDYCPDWDYGASLINENYFEDYARDFVEDCYGLGDMPDFVEIDWSQTADNIRIDYTEIQFEDETYLIR